MKLWQKISLISVIVLLLTVAVLSALLLAESRRNTLQLAEAQARAKQKNLQISFSENVSYYASFDLQDIDDETIAKYSFGHFADEECVLTLEGRTIYSISDIRPQEHLPHADGQQSIQVEVNGARLLIAGNTLSLPGGYYTVYVVQDITGVYEGITRMAWRFALISGLCILAGMALIILLIRRATKPLGMLGTQARRIAAGEYAERAAVSHDEVGMLATDFNAMAGAVQERIEQLEEAAERSRLFIGGLTHEFKTPMTSLLIHSDMLLGAKMDEKDAASSLMHIHSQIRWLERLTQELLKLITLKEDIRLRAESVEELFDSVRESTRETLQQRGISLLTSSDTDTLTMNADLMQSLLINLIDNASKASEPGQSVFLRAYDNVIKVEDNGCGIPEDELKRVTEPFYTVDRSRSKKQGGSGLGLALVKSIADAHGARLIIKSEPGKGTVVSIELSN